MKQFETKLTVRIYDTKIIECLNTIFKMSKNRYLTKNQLLVELLERGIKDKMKELTTPPDSPAGASAIPPSFNSKDDIGKRNNGRAHIQQSKVAGKISRV